ncbi:MAG: dihydroorotate dehydrogenase electron transfer subunit [Oscillospiraceae bacterium]|nr:dihydroorotate dehydrogenase electron transfer subunit [Oscillospiraceae bacterium]
MKQGIYTVEENTPLAEGVFRMRLRGDTSAVTRPGQFINIRLDGKFLRRPISVCDWDDGTITIIYKLLGDGTERMSRYPAGKTLDVLTGLGNGFDVGRAGERPLLIGGGVGTPPMYALAKQLLAAGKRVQAVLGFNSAADVFYADELRDLGAAVRVATADGSRGVKGFVTDALAGLDYSYYYACGPEPMLRAVWKTAVTDGELSFEERMGCGFGACMGCTCKTLTGFKRICRDGPVLRKGELLWDD